MVLLGDEAQVEARFSPFGDTANVDVRQVYSLAQKSFWTHPMVLLGEEAQLEARRALFGDSANLNAR